jgi:ERCC4-related helicase
MPSFAFNFQKHIIKNVINRGRSAAFVDTGLGKTLMELVVAQNFVKHTNKNVLIITPLAVAFQFIKENDKFGITDIEYSKQGKFTKKVVVCNFERLQYFDPHDFDCVILDESSILKNDKGATRQKVTHFLKKVKYRFLFTATPSPNDFIELGTSSEALGFLGYTDMLTKFFKNNEDTISPQSIGTKWRLKGHAEKAFFEWVSSWSISMRKPSDLGFSDRGFELPKLITNHNVIKNTKNMVEESGQILLFNKIKKTRKEIASERRTSINELCEKAVDLASNYDTSVYWCNLNKEGDLLSKLDKDAIQLKGNMPLDEKEDILLNFGNGNIKKLITKAKMTSFGLNWQHCNHTVFFPTFSYEQYYQAIRRFWRFGQKKEVVCDLVYSDGMKRVVKSLEVKQKKADKLFNSLNSAINSTYKDTTKKVEHNKVDLPNFI